MRAFTYSEGFFIIPYSKKIFPKIKKSCTFVKINFMEETKVLNENVSFGIALISLKLGEKVMRSGWNGKGMWLKLVNPYTEDFPIRDTEVENLVEGSTMLPWIGMKTADNQFVPWLASQTDILATDWIIHHTYGKGEIVSDVKAD